MDRLKHYTFRVICRSGRTRGAWLVVASLLLAACATEVVVSPPSEAVRASQDREIMQQIERKAVHGDWLVIRGYHATDHLLSTATNIPLSHAAVLDMERRQVIEADASGVHITALADFVHRSHRLLVIHPI